MVRGSLGRVGWGDSMGGGREAWGGRGQHEACRVNPGAASPDHSHLWSVVTTGGDSGPPSYYPPWCVMPRHCTVFQWRNTTKEQGPYKHPHTTSLETQDRSYMTQTIVPKTAMPTWPDFTWLLTQLFFVTGVYFGKYILLRCIFRSVSDL